MANILIIRFSAIGDVAMTVPVIDSLARQHPDDTYTVVSQSFLMPLFAYLPANVSFLGVNLQTDHKGMAGMYRLYQELSRKKFDAVADLHDVLRTKLLRTLFRFSGLRVKYIDKGRSEKKQLTRKKHKILKQLKSSTERYADVFRALGQSVEPDFHSIFGISRGDFRMIESLTGAKSKQWIGIAPFAKHQGKILPIERTEQIVAHFAHLGNVTLFLFGGGHREKAVLESWCDKYPNCVSVVGKFGIAEELVLMSYLDVMFSMDSANMHLASLTATPVVSVWGATHPYAGFYGYHQPIESAVQVDLFCRPCSVYGNKPCYRKDWACLMNITPEKIIDKITAIINTKSG